MKSFHVAISTSYVFFLLFLNESKHFSFKGFICGVSSTFSEEIYLRRIDRNI